MKKHTYIYILWLFQLCMVSCIGDLMNTPPVIEMITLDPSGNYTPGSEIMVSAVVWDREGDELQFYWESADGIIAEPEQFATTWELSVNTEPLSYETLSLTVSDGREQTVKSRIIQVSEGLIMNGYTWFAGTHIPIPEVEITIGKFSTVSDENGYYFIQHLKEGEELVTAVKEGFDPFEYMVYVDNPVSNYNIFMSSPAGSRRVSGFVRTIDSVTYKGLKVVLLNPDGSESKLSGLTDQDGYYEIETVPFGKRSLMVRNTGSQELFHNDTAIYIFDVGAMQQSYNARIKIRRDVLLDSYLSGMDLWEYDGDTRQGFYVLEKGRRMKLKEFINVPADAEDPLLFINSYVVGGCSLVGTLPSHRVWIVNGDDENIGGISWGGEGNNYKAEVSWFPSDSPTFMNLNGHAIKLCLELSGESDCVPNPLWRIYTIEFNYYY
ncbi:MAG: carboxypeptidase regulatory-like domain-containing protein [Bacteroidales bacterium]|nr:carboxypeptidase regulatory-like domain-containing protein [Bacteroidales bacterium]MBN2697472.1 carboxypeptidase regulatory-like domain-containing protein [Bacteroidales bacterium]